MKTPHRWRTLKSSLLLRPVYHWTEPRIRAHIFICVLALHIERWMRNKLQTVSVPKALQSLQRIKAGELSINGKRVTMATKPTTEQKELLQKLGVTVGEFSLYRFTTVFSFQERPGNCLQKTCARKKSPPLLRASNLPAVFGS